jgi:hypothetical protein
MLSIISLLFFIYSFLNFNSIIEKKDIYAKFIIGKTIGIDVNGTALTFGMLPNYGLTSTRSININNNYSHDVLIQIMIDGNISEYLIVSENDFILKPNEKKKIDFIVTSCANCPEGTYDGIVIILTKNPKYLFLRKITKYLKFF